MSVTDIGVAVGAVVVLSFFAWVAQQRPGDDRRARRKNEIMSVGAILSGALLLAGCASTKPKATSKTEYYLKCGFTLHPFADAQQWPEPLCQNGPPL